MSTQAHTGGKECDISVPLAQCPWWYTIRFKQTPLSDWWAADFLLVVKELREGYALSPVPRDTNAFLPVVICRIGQNPVLSIQSVPNTLSSKYESVCGHVAAGQWHCDTMREKHVKNTRWSCMALMGMNISFLSQAPRLWMAAALRPQSSWLRPQSSVTSPDTRPTNAAHRHPLWSSPCSPSWKPPPQSQHPLRKMAPQTLELAALTDCCYYFCR